MDYLSQSSESEISRKISADKWSKKEILGHLIDSGRNNLQRFTEIQFCEDKPYKKRPYNQNQLIKVNDYHYVETSEITALWLSLNNRIKKIIALQSKETLGYTIDLGNDNISDLRFLVTDYVDHLEHYLNQIMI